MSNTTTKTTNTKCKQNEQEFNDKALENSVRCEYKKEIYFLTIKSQKKETSL